MSEPTNSGRPEPREGSQQQPEFGQYAPAQESYAHRSSSDDQPQYGQRIPQYGQQGYPLAPLPQVPPQFDTNGNVFGQQPSSDSPWYGIGFGHAIQRFFTKYAVFSGRASRGEVWWLVLFNILVTMALSPLGLISPTVNTWAGYIWEAAVFIPWLAVGARRLHDANISGWWIVLPNALTYGGSLAMQFFVSDDIQEFANYVVTHNTIEGYPQDIQTTLALASVLVLMTLAGTILWVVFMCLSSKSAGARFDKIQPSQFGNNSQLQDQTSMPNSSTYDPQQPNFHQAG
ncbi:MAG: DUF805 domain-containing protein [Bifidobacterium sp.]|jgi:uncharacterized membrane protein YhaH (DUF805 family)|nr:DUF805 domain-containing protein [Bifidobacterium sp.]MCH4175842.1 DUF805 domain-containing protein [Bifidobacterium sp.]